MKSLMTPKGAVRQYRTVGYLSDSLASCLVYGYDIYPRILLEAKAQLAHPLFILYDTSLRVKKLPVDWCTANIVPIYNKKAVLSQGIRAMPL